MKKPWNLHLATIAAAAGLPILLFAVVVLWLYGTQVDRAARGQLSQAAQSTLSAVEREVASQFTVLQTLASSRDLREGDLAGFHERLLWALQDQPQWYSIVLVDRLRAHVNTRFPFGASLPPHVDAEAVNRVFDTGQAEISGIHREPRRLPEPFVILRLPIKVDLPGKEGEGAVKYVLAAALRVSALDDRLRAQGIPAGWHLAVLDRHHRLVALAGRFDPPDARLGNAASSSMVDGMARSRDGFFAGDGLDGDALVATAVLSPLTGWTIVAGAPAELLSRPVRWLVWLAAGGGMAALALALTLSTGLIRGYRHRQKAERRVLMLEAERDAERRLADVAERLPGIIYRQVRHANGQDSFPFISDASLLPGLAGTGGGTAIEAITERLAPEARERWNQALREAAATGKPFDIEVELRNPEGRSPAEGRSQWVRGLARTRREPDGTVIWDGVLLDVTDLKTTEAALRRQEDLLAHIMDTLPVGVWVLDETGRIIRSNPAGRQIWGGARYVGIGQYGQYKGWWADTGRPIAPEDWNGARAIRRGEVSLGEVIDIESFDGTSKTILASAVPVRAEDGRILGAVVVNEDITKRRHAEAALRESEARFRTMADHAPVMIRVTDQAGACSYLNWNWYAITGQAPEAGLGYGWMDCVHPDDWETVHRAFQAAGRGRTPLRLEYRLRRRNGGHGWVIDAAAPRFGEDGTFLGYVGSIIDIDARKATEAALQAAKEDAERANRAKSTFLAAASHDLRQPLSAMALLLGVLRPRVAEGSARDVVDRIQSSLDAMVTLFNALLDISKLDAGAVAPDRGPVAVARLFSQIAIDFMTAAETKGLVLRVLPCGAVLWTDAILIERILRNLVSNAVRYSERGRVLVGGRRRGDRLRIDVLDTGPGIPADQLETIFEEFHQLKNPASRGKGHGLGLAIVRRMAAVLGHRLEVASVLGHGSRFSIEVPLAVPAAATGGRSVLVVEDDPPRSALPRRVMGGHH